jgi:hypothetical protein
VNTAWVLVMVWMLLNVGGAAYYIGKSNGYRESVRDIEHTFKRLGLLP